MHDRIANHGLIEPEQFTLRMTGHHDTMGISPLHVSVIKTLAGVIGVNPKKECLDLASHVSIAALDSLSTHAEDGNGLAFRYTGFGEDLLVICWGNGDIFVYEAC